MLLKNLINSNNLINNKNNYNCQIKQNNNCNLLHHLKLNNSKAIKPYNNNLKKFSKIHRSQLLLFKLLPFPLLKQIKKLLNRLISKQNNKFL